SADIDSRRHHRTRDRIDRQALDLPRCVERNGGRNGGMHPTLAIEVLLHDRARVPLKKTVEQGTRPAANNALADRSGKFRAADDQLRCRPACDCVLELDLIVRGRARTIWCGGCRASARKPPRPDASLEAALLAIEGAESIAIALPGTE